VTTPVKEAGGFLNASGTAFTVTVPAGGYPAGNTLIASVITLATTVDGLTVTDAAGNAWTTTSTVATSDTSRVYLAKTTLTSALAAGAVITFTLATAATRAAASVLEFTGAYTAGVVAASNQNSGTAISTPTVTPAADSLVIAALGLVNAGRIFTATSPWVAATKVLSTAGTSDRGIQLSYRDAVSGSATAFAGTLNSSGSYAVLEQAFAPATAPPAPPGAGTVTIKTASGGVFSSHTAHPKAYVGGAWVPAKPKRWNGTWVAL
jgi:hypothetical protein